MMGLRFQAPFWLLLIIPLALLCYAWWTNRRRAAVVYSETALPAQMPITLALRIKRLLPWLGFVGMLLAVIALARPQRGESEFRVRTEGIAIEMCLDRSGSMQAMDFTLNGQPTDRINAVKHVFSQFVLGDDDQLSGRPDDMIGLIDFGGYADSKCPLTLDHEALAEVVKGVKVAEPFVDGSGNINQRLMQEEWSTAIGDAIGLAVGRLKDNESKSRVIILLSDGESNAGVLAPVEAAQLAKSLGIKIYTIAIGANGYAPLPTYNQFTGEKTGYSDQLVSFDPTTLQEIAKITDGQYFHAQDTESLQNVYAQIDALEKTEQEGRVYTEYAELYPWLLWPALLLILLEKLLAATRFRSLP